MNDLPTTDAAVRARIDTTLETIEIEHSIRLHYACESGSRAWGFASSNSDYDVRFLYVRPVEEYLVLKPPRDVIELPIVEELDVNGWDLFKACRLLRKSNPPLLEWLGSPTVYLETDGLAQQLRDQAREHFSARACCEHHLSAARTNYQKHVHERKVVIRKKYLYILRPLACIHWILGYETFPPTAFADVLAGIDLPTVVRSEIELLLHAKRENHELGEAPANRPLDAFIRSELEALPEIVSAITPRAFPADGLNAIIRSTLLAS